MKFKNIQRYSRGAVDRRKINGSNVVLILGDNIFHGHDLSNRLTKLSNQNIPQFLHIKLKTHLTMGIVNFDKNQNPINLIEKPKNPSSKFAITGMYFLIKMYLNMQKQLRPSKRKELEITDLNKIYLNKRKLKVFFLDRGDVWLDAGTHVTLMQAGQYIQTIEERQGLKISCQEEIAWKLKLISDLEVKKSCIEI